MSIRPKVVVIGAGAFGGWTALYMQRQGASVTLIDAWGPGNSRSSSGGETRVIRGAYGPNQPYTGMSARSMTLWREHEREWKQQFLDPIGVLWMAEEEDDSFEKASLVPLKEAGIPYDELPSEELSKRWPQINFERVRWAIWEPQSGYLLARASCQIIVEHFVSEGGSYKQAAVLPQSNEESAGQVLLSDGSRLVADHYVYACGPWLGKLFPRTIGANLKPTRQDVILLGTPAGDTRYNAGSIPVWADHRDHFMYGIPGNQGRGFKVADDTRGTEFDPTAGERMVDPARVQEARSYAAFRFPGLKDAPVVETRVCQYENTPDRDYILDRHPEVSNVWIAGGGSGHGFKNGPAVGELMAEMVLRGRAPEPRFRVARFKNISKR